jgi:homoserine O-succinyltransferase/O-acetyltransferase
MIVELQLRRSIASRTADCITVGLINNMPDAAIKATERQFTGLLQAAASDTTVRLKLFSISEVPRSVEMRRELEHRYCSLSGLWDAHLDGLIVTGTEPRAASLKDEPFWVALGTVIDWARENSTSTIWSCLAAHAAVLHTDGIERHLMPCKRFGVFDCQIAGSHPLTRHTDAPIRVPHSRHNELTEPDLLSCGYQILTKSAVAGVDTFCKQGKSLFIFFQGHPEYEADTLLREYRRDIGRFLDGETANYPSMPLGMFNDEKVTIANEFRDRALSQVREDLVDAFPMGALEAGLANTWRTSSVAFYRRWISYLHSKAKRRIRPRIPTGREWPVTAQPVAIELP